jgi:isoleucyl-tRNA synthetase
MCASTWRTARICHSQRLALTEDGAPLDDVPTSMAIWTTTPWTLPANRAVTVHPQFDYSLIEFDWAGRERLVLAAELVDTVMQTLGVTEWTVDRQVKGDLARAIGVAASLLRSAGAGDPGRSRDSGCRHRRRAHGAGSRPRRLHRRPPLQLGSRQSRRRRRPIPAGTPLFAGEQVFDANPHVIKVLHDNGRLLKDEPYHHSYPHCWRHKTPVIFRATPQWFISMDQAGLRKGALEAISHVDWMPSWGEQRISGMIAGRPGLVRVAATDLGRAHSLVRRQGVRRVASANYAEFIEEVAKLVERDGIDAWFDLDAAALLGADADQYDKATDVMDVWFDSGVVHHAVSQMRPEITAPADLYLGRVGSAPRLVP